MANLNIFAGFDVSKKFFDVCIFKDGNEQHRQFDYNNTGLDDLIQWLPDQAHCVMEATGPYYLKLASHLHRCGFKVSVVNPLVIKRFSQMRLLRAKTDKADARMIASYALTENPAPWQPPAAYLIKLQQLDSLLQQLQKHRTALLCQLEAFTATDAMDQELKLLLRRNIAHLEKQIAIITEKMELNIEREHQQLLRSVMSVPGIGKKTAIMLIVISNGFKKFETSKQFSAYVGLSPRIYQSGISVKGKGRICKMGTSRIRALLYLCTWSAKQCNQSCKELFARLIAKGKSKRLALIAVANKLIKQVFAIAKANTIYQPNYSKNICF